MLLTVDSSHLHSITAAAIHLAGNFILFRTSYSIYIFLYGWVLYYNPSWWASLSGSANRPQRTPLNHEVQRLPLFTLLVTSCLVWVGTALQLSFDYGCYMIMSGGGHSGRDGWVGGWTPFIVSTMAGAIPFGGHSNPFRLDRTGSVNLRSDWRTEWCRRDRPFWWTESGVATAKEATRTLSLIQKLWNDVARPKKAVEHKHKAIRGETIPLNRMDKPSIDLLFILQVDLLGPHPREEVPVASVQVYT